ncbi:MAG: hypothetical protein Q4D81_00515 [Eubacteriales bacterium]|nr:hypothetical protein [Eubacteriales bacterium]
MLITGITSTGFEYEVDKEVLTDFEFLELLADVQAGGQNGMKVFAMIRKALGEEQKARLCDHCRAESGRVPLDSVTNEITEIFSALGENPETKN